MRLATCTSNENEFVGIVADNRIMPLERIGPFPSTMLELISAGPKLWQQLREAASRGRAASIPLSEVQLMAPIRRPPKNIMCLGWNYSAHASESARTEGKSAELPELPIVFTKAPTTINAPYGEIPYDASLSTHIDWEVELAVIIGVRGRNIPRERALEHVFGYTVLNDITARDLQRKHKQFFIGKSLDGACPMGPWIVTRDEIPDPQTLRLCSRVNGVLKQDSTTANQIFDVATTISLLSRGMTLEPGDIIATGTPDGVGYARTPPEFLQPGDTVECEIEWIGTIRNRISTT